MQLTLAVNYLRAVQLMMLLINKLDQRLPYPSNNVQEVGLVIRVAISGLTDGHTSYYHLNPCIPNLDKHQSYVLYFQQVGFCQVSLS
jgi:hypothetical protein